MDDGRTVWYPKEYLPPCGTQARQQWENQEAEAERKKMALIHAQEARAKWKKREAEFKKLTDGAPVVGEDHTRAFFLGMKEEG